MIDDLIRDDVRRVILNGIDKHEYLFKCGIKDCYYLAPTYKQRLRLDKNGKIPKKYKKQGMIFEHRELELFRPNNQASNFIEDFISLTGFSKIIPEAVIIIDPDIMHKVIPKVENLSDFLDWWEKDASPKEKALWNSKKHTRSWYLLDFLDPMRGLDIEHSGSRWHTKKEDNKTTNWFKIFEDILRHEYLKEIGLKTYEMFDYLRNTKKTIELKRLASLAKQEPLLEKPFLPDWTEKAIDFYLKDNKKSLEYFKKYHYEEGIPLGNIAETFIKPIDKELYESEAIYVEKELIAALKNTV